ncbi:potassium-transporting ATPase subunit C [Enterococcus gallinarum]|uniref:potassium-transporting ATPase subunit C n=1 Tax=Enterococcus gallinarum TaxID=1353 RepID=UPI001D17C0DC|nr:potassium-transporting ATPase subunit C [Enterococcus gallinarum]MCC4044520.1 potassium-transporting ATPase subunit C [Enterococcus gallinarum]
MKKILGTQLRFLVISILFFGGLYTAVITGVGQLLFSNQANGSQRIVDGEIIGSTLIGQQFLQPGYFAGRSDAVSQLSPVSAEQETLVSDRKTALQRENQITEVPVDLVTASASGVDPHITVAAAEVQVPRIAKERNRKESAIRAIIKENTQKDWFSDRTFVNVLELNLALDKL